MVDPRVLELVEEVIDSGRTSEQVCADEPELLVEVRCLVEQCRSNDLQLSEWFVSIPLGGTPAAVAECPGAEIGPYKLLRQIGEGGFGVVFMAEQMRPVRRRVAMKVIKAGMDTKEVIARFEAERQALALMDHLNIARVFDAGATASGRPYFVMELVDGVPITEYCDKHRLSIAQRLELIIPVCRAVQSAHQKGIIHRDLKPSNVLITVQDGAAVPKVIDFGIAKATGAGEALTDRTPFTVMGGFVGTPAYMSPEQAERSGLNVDTRTDVYGLGVLLYELLTGTTPIDSATLKAAAWEQVARIIRTAEPPKPSAKLSGLSGTLSAVAAARGSDPRRLVQLVRGELDWIVMKALESDRTRRYDTAAALADDLVRTLGGDPVAAGPPGARYRVRKFARKYRAAFGVAAVLGAAVLLGVAGLSVGLVRAAAARRVAEARQHDADSQRHLAEQSKADADTQRRAAEAVVDFLTKDVFAKASPANTGDPAVRDTLVRVLIEPALQTVGQRFKDQPLILAAVQYNLAATLNDLGRSDLALVQAKAAWQLRQAVLGPLNPLTIKAIDEYAIALARQDRWVEVEPLIRTEWENYRRAEGNDAKDTVWALADYAGALITLGRPGDARAVLKDTVAAERRAGRAGTAPFAYLLETEGEILREHGDWADAIAPWQEATGLLRRVAPDDADRPRDLFWLGICLMATGRPADAQPVFREKCACELRYASPGRPTSAVSALSEAVEALSSFVNASPAEHQSGRAKAMLRAGLLFARGDFLRQTGDVSGAVVLLRQSNDLLRAAAPDTLRRGRDLYWLGLCLLASGHPADAETILRENYAWDLKSTGSILPVLPASLQALLASIHAQGKPCDVESIRLQFRSAS